ncbi:glycosyltransferase family 2 protein [Niabella ginsengisoli]|uniref:Glycosyltransferase family 2 protein n=1 Tax=Niabella ginsengisoli TaxID=522298 RepID=A0ABS9SER0_9BACT|nr:glycosyltransferase family 2 protein [Niabella ginsengisoli]MCH5596833.1 glycosyltransferase family 2 protein [Niabella ginsengisoli]
MPFISICIPAYKRSNFLERLLQSIAIQDYKDFEIIVTDDSPNDEVKLVCEKYSDEISILYHKNETALSTPANWNKAISLAKGEWIKLMHDDDWLATASALQQFADCAKKNDNAFIFSAYTNVYEKDSSEKIVFPEKFRLLQADKEPSILVAKNFIGPPSVTMHKNDRQHLYDPALKWLVDIDMYRRRIETDKLVYINQPLVKVYMSNSQVTAYTKNIGNIEIPEHFHFLNKMGINKLKNILVYDYNWRFLRNFRIENIKQIEDFGYDGSIHPILKSMIGTQSKLPRALLRSGVISKLLMTLHFLKNKHKIK